MAKVAIVKGSTNVTVYVFIQDSSSTTGEGLTGLVFNSASLTCYYVRPLAAAAELTLATQTTTGAHSDGGFVEVDSTNMKGVYRLDLSDAICATGVDSVALQLRGATNMAPCNLEIQLTDFDLNLDGLSTQVKADVNAEVDTALADIGLDHLMAAAVVGGDVTDNSVVAKLVSKSATADWDDFANMTDSLQAIFDDKLTAAAVDAEVDTALTDIGLDHLLAAAVVGADVTDNSVFAKLVSKSATADWDNFVNTTDSLQAQRDNIGSPVGADISADIAGVQSDTDDIQTRLPAALVSGRIDSSVGAMAANVMTAAAAAADFSTEIRDAVTGGAYALDTDANGRIRIVDGTAAGEINTASGAIVQVDQLGTQAKSDVNAEVVDALNVDTYAEPGQETPAATASLVTKIGYSYKLLRNKRDQDGSTLQIYGDDAATVDHKAAVSESAGTVTIGELATGP